MHNTVGGLRRFHNVLTNMLNQTRRPPHDRTAQINNYTHDRTAHHQQDAAAAAAATTTTVRTYQLPAMLHMLATRPASYTCTSAHQRRVGGDVCLGQHLRFQLHALRVVGGLTEQLLPQRVVSCNAITTKTTTTTTTPERGSEKQHNRRNTNAAVSI